MNLKKFIYTVTVSVEASSQREALVMSEELIASGQGTTKVREDSGKKQGRPKLSVATDNAAE